MACAVRYSAIPRTFRELLTVLRDGKRGTKSQIKNKTKQTKAERY